MLESFTDDQVKFAEKYLLNERNFDDLVAKESLSLYQKIISSITFIQIAFCREHELINSVFFDGVMVILIIRRNDMSKHVVSPAVVRTTHLISKYYKIGLYS